MRANILKAKGFARWCLLPLALAAGYGGILAAQSQVARHLERACLESAGGGDFCFAPWFGPANFASRSVFAALFAASTVLMAFYITPYQRRTAAILGYVGVLTLMSTEALGWPVHVSFRDCWPWPTNGWPEALVAAVAGWGVLRLRAITELRARHHVS